MKASKPAATFAPQEVRRFISPLTIASLLILAGIITEAVSRRPAPNLPLAFYGGLGIAYIATVHILLIRSVFRHGTYRVLNSVLAGIGIGILTYLLSERLNEITHILVVFSVVVTTMISGRMYAYLTLLLVVAVSLPAEFSQLRTADGILDYTTPFVISVIVAEVIIRIKNTAHQHIHRLEIINQVSREIMQTLDTKQTFSLLDKTIQDTLGADTYFIGIVKDGKIQFELFFDDGKYFNGIRVPLEGTLSGWVIKNQQVLFLPDLTEEVELDGVERFIIGRDRTSLSWISVPLKAENVTGVLALASHSANAFDRADLELLINLGQHVTLALDNTIRHAQVERQARLDSLTGVYNHGYFLKMLAEQAEQISRSQKHLSLIMLDIDYFKQYNDTYGHLVGDRILNALCSAIQHNIKQTDAVGRWGGEEFVISLPGATGKQAFQIAKRIGETIRSLRVVDRDQRSVPIPTVSQGIAIYPNEADEIYRLIDAADRRLYVAKERGRNQIEPGADFWDE